MFIHCVHLDYSWKWDKKHFSFLIYTLLYCKFGVGGTQRSTGIAIRQNRVQSPHFQAPFTWAWGGCLQNFICKMRMNSSVSCSKYWTHKNTQPSTWHIIPHRKETVAVLMRTKVETARASQLCRVSYWVLVRQGARAGYTAETRSSPNSLI